MDMSQSPRAANPESIETDLSHLRAADLSQAHQGGRWARFVNGTIAKKLRTLFDASGTLAVLIAITAFASLSWMASRDANSGELATANRLVAEIDREVFESQKALAEVSRSGNGDFSGVAKDHLATAVSHAESLRQLPAIADAVSEDEIDELEAAVRDVQELMERSATAQGPSDTTYNEIINAGIVVASQSKLLMTDINDELVALQDHSLSLAKWFIVLMGLLFVGALAITSFARRMVRHDIAYPLERVSEAMVSVAKGDREAEIPEAERPDEIGDMARCLIFIRKAAAKADEAALAATSAAEAELARQVEEEEERRRLRAEQAEKIRELADKFNQTVGEIVGTVASASSELQATATAMAASAEQSSNQSAKVSSALAEATAGVTAAAAASDEFAMSIGEISRQASTSAELARKASGAAVDADQTISELTTSASEVGKIVELISTIAQRTNLLALNASIEAARGGEAGRGFAVVATEVKELATQTGKATEEVSAQIRAMQDTTTASVTALRDIAAQIKQLETTAVSIAAAVDQQSVAGQDLARSIDLAARSAEDVTGSIEQVRETSLATGSAASQVLTSSTELEKQATYLKTKATDFIDHVREG